MLSRALFVSGCLLMGASLAAAQDAETPIKVKDMPGFCHKKAVDLHVLKPNKVKVKKAAQGADAFTVAGTADLGENGKRTFHCAFDLEGKFVKMVVDTTGTE